MPFLYPKFFPFCVEESNAPTGDGTYYPFGMTLEDAMALYWKFLSIKINDNIIYTLTVGDSFCTGQHSFSKELSTDSYWPTKMSEMICPPSPFFYGSAFGPDGIFTSSIGGVYESGASYQIIFGENIIKKIENGQEKYYPRFLLEIATDLEYGTAFSTFNSGGLSSKIVKLVVGVEYQTSLYINPRIPNEYLSLGGEIKIEKASDRIAE